MTKIILLVLLSVFHISNNTSLKVIVKNVQVGKGNVFVSIYNDEKQFFKKAFVEKDKESTNQQLEFSFDIPQGEYAISVYQDINGNKQLDFGMFHIPKEPTGFSNNFRPSFSAPQFKDAAIKLTQPVTSSIIELK